MSFPAGLLTITVTGLNVLDLGGNPLNGQVIFTPTGPLEDPAVNLVLAGSAIGTVVDGVMTSLVIPATDCVSPAFTYTITVRLADAEGAEGSPPPVTGVSIPHTLGPTVDLSALL